MTSTSWMLDALHVTNGDCTDVAGTGLARQVVQWRDTLHEGPVPAVGADRLRRTRADFLAAVGGIDRGDVGQGDVGQGDVASALLERDAALEAGRDGEYVLWFEADLYDQLQIIEILNRLVDLDVDPARVTLICIGEHVGIARFGGLGELSADQLRQLPDTGVATRLTGAAFELASQAWQAFRAPEPAGLAAIAASRSGELRFLGEAFDRLCREYPSTRDGLALSERRLVAAVAAGAADAGTAFVRAAQRETRPFLGDSWAFARIERLARVAQPLVEPDPAERPVDQTTRLRVTDVGRAVLAGEADHVRRNGLDRWLGGVHLVGADVPWRWDDGTESLVTTTRQ